MDLRIVIDDEPATVSSNVRLLILGALSYLSDEDQFPGFRAWLVDMALADPADPGVAAWFAHDLRPDTLTYLAARVAAGWHRDQQDGTLEP